MAPLKSPYSFPADGSRQAALCYISTADWAYLKACLPSLTGKYNIILSLFLHSLCKTLRSYERTNGPFTDTWDPLSAPYSVLATFMERCTSECPTGSTGEKADPRNASCGVDGIHQTDLASAPKRRNEKRKLAQGVRRRTKKTTGQEVPEGPGSGGASAVE